MHHSCNYYYTETPTCLCTILRSHVEQMDREACIRWQLEPGQRRILTTATVLQQRLEEDNMILWPSLTTHRVVRIVPKVGSRQKTNRQETRIRCKIVISRGSGKNGDPASRDAPPCSKSPRSQGRFGDQQPHQTRQGSRRRSPREAQSGRTRTCPKVAWRNLDHPEPIATDPSMD